MRASVSLSILFLAAMLLAVLLMPSPIQAACTGKGGVAIICPPGIPDGSKFVFINPAGGKEFQKPGTTSSDDQVTFNGPCCTPFVTGQGQTGLTFEGTSFQEEILRAIGAIGAGAFNPYAPYQTPKERTEEAAAKELEREAFIQAFTPTQPQIGRETGAAQQPPPTTQAGGKTKEGTGLAIPTISVPGAAQQPTPRTQEQEPTVVRTERDDKGNEIRTLSDGSTITIGADGVIYYILKPAEKPQPQAAGSQPGGQGGTQVATPGVQPAVQEPPPTTEEKGPEADVGTGLDIPTISVPGVAAGGGQGTQVAKTGAEAEAAAKEKAEKEKFDREVGELQNRLQNEKDPKKQKQIRGEINQKFRDFFQGQTQKGVQQADAGNAPTPAPTAGGSTAPVGSPTGR